MAFQLNNKSAIITGGGSGIGKAISKIFAESGAIVSIIELSKENAEQTLCEITEAGGTAYVYSCDVSNQQNVFNTINDIKKNNGIDILVNNAGIAHIGKLEDTKEEDLDRLYAVNIKGAYNCMLACIETMKQNKKGVILNLVSIAASLGIPDRFAYSMTKGAALTMTYSVAKDYLDYNIRCNSISPARIHTPFVDGFLAKNYPGQEKEMFDKLSASQPIGRMGTPEEVANLALYLCSDEAGFITGTDFPIDGGFIKLNT